MIGTTGLKGLRVECVVGVYEHERRWPQTIVVDVELDYDFAAPAASDDVADCVDYDRVARGLTVVAQQGQFQLIETMAERMALAIFAGSPAVRTVRLELCKPAAVPAAECSFVRVERSRP